MVKFIPPQIHSFHHLIKNCSPSKISLSLYRSTLFKKPCCAIRYTKWNCHFKLSMVLTLSLKEWKKHTTTNLSRICENFKIVIKFTYFSQEAHFLDMIYRNLTRTFFSTIIGGSLFNASNACNVFSFSRTISFVIFPCFNPSENNLSSSVVFSSCHWSCHRSHAYYVFG